MGAEQAAHKNAVETTDLLRSLEWRTILFCVGPLKAGGGI